MEAYKYIKCKIFSGGFSGERTFEIQLSNQKPLRGTASVRYLRDQNKAELSEDVPGYGNEISGYLMCRVLETDEDGKNVTVEIPSSDLAFVPQDSLENVTSA